MGSRLAQKSGMAYASSAHATPERGVRDVVAGGGGGGGGAGVDVFASGICARCHQRQAGLAAEGGHAPFLDCLTCHEDRRPGTFGPRHRAIPTSCTTHHTTTIAAHPPP